MRLADDKAKVRLEGCDCTIAFGVMVEKPLRELGWMRMHQIFLKKYSLVLGIADRHVFCM